MQRYTKGARKLTGKYVRQIAASNRALEQITEMLGHKMDRKAILHMDIGNLSDQQIDDALATTEAELAKIEKDTNSSMVH